MPDLAKLVEKCTSDTFYKNIQNGSKVKISDENEKMDKVYYKNIENW